MLTDHFGVPVFMNNDGDLFAYGEAIAGFLPKVNRLLDEAGSPKRYQNLFAVTLGTGFGGGIVRNGELFLGDNSAAGEIWLLRNKAGSDAFVEEGASIRAVQSTYAQIAGIDAADGADSEGNFRDRHGASRRKRGGRPAGVRHAWRSGRRRPGQRPDARRRPSRDRRRSRGAARLFMPRLIEEMNGTIAKYTGERIPRLAQRVFDLDDKSQRDQFLRGETCEITVPRSQRKIAYDPLKRIGVGVSELGANQAIGIGAYAYALQQLDR